ncbi:BTAD domain-containing putative transcriptional regulator [Pseudonocardia humida]|uniref:Winged helix-turn-helix domain-containing protein n=1 Tax=Pseudonocardia humida TaxID=2800819 RepID=A0ABT1A7Y0_9PSEU|nr:BTAD domain-containing putative transcriptional regulator [Pseudonocardia humida]MCO1659066.1 winged helix-turn-helix domain-containing protein [Pseudonocardia humida]
MHFGLLGPLAVWTADGRPVRLPELKVRALLAHLLVHRGRLVSAERLIDDLWGAALPANPANTLQGKVSQLRRVLDAAEPGGRGLVAYRQGGYLLQVEADSVDADRFHALTERARRAPDPRTGAGLLGDALALWRGDALADFAGEAFARAAIVRLEEARLVALEEQAAARLELGEHHLLAGELSDVVAQHPLRSRLREVHMRALYRAGRQSEALDSYHQLRSRLVDEQGLEPGPELAALQQAILRRAPELDAPADPPAAARMSTNLPTPLTDLIGREDAVAAARSLLASGRLVTLTGPGGVGKTRLAVETAGGMAGTFPDGVWLVELASLGGRAAQGPAALAGAIMAVLDMRPDIWAPAARADPVNVLAAALGAKQLLLILDNCEGLADPVATLAARLLEAATGLRILATSQEPLRVPGELLQVVEPLALPDPAAATDLGVVRRSAAVQLFEVRATAAAPGFVLDRSNAADVAAICRGLDGIPLALELAAARVRALGVRELASRLSDRFRLLASGYRDSPPRQQTLRAVIDWSWELLDEPERILLRRVAVHSGSFALEAAGSICSGDDLPAGDIPEVLARLVDRSLVGVDAHADGHRYRLLESVAAYGRERAGAIDELSWLRERHGRYYTALAERAASQLRGPGQRTWLDRLDAETGNLRSALESAVGDRGAVLALRLVNALTWYWVLRGRLSEGSRSLATALALDGEAPSVARARAVAAHAAILLGAGEAAEPTAVAEAALEPFDGVDDPHARAHAEWMIGYGLTFGVGETGLGEELVERGLATFLALGDQWGIAAALGVRAVQALAKGDLAAVARDSEQSLAMFRALGDRWGQLIAMQGLADLARLTGDYDRAARLHRKALRTSEELGLWAEASFWASGLGRIALLTGDHEQARAFIEQGRRLAAEHAIRFAEEYADVGLALLARAEGELDAAEAHLRRWLDWDRQVDAHANAALILTELGFIAELRGDAEAARVLHRDGYAAALAGRDARMAARALDGLAGADALAGEHHRAARLLAAAARSREAAGGPLPPAERGDVERITGVVRAALGTGFATVVAGGEADAPAELVQGRG